MPGGAEAKVASGANRRGPCVGEALQRGHPPVHVLAGHAAPPRVVLSLVQGGTICLESCIARSCG